MHIEVDYNPTPANTFFVSVSLGDKEDLSFDYTTKGHRVIKQVLIGRKEIGVQDLDKKEISGEWDVIELKDGRFVRKYHAYWVDKGKIDEVNNKVWETVWSKPMPDEVKSNLLEYSRFVSDNYQNLDNFQDRMKEFENYVGELVKEFAGEEKLDCPS